MGKRKQSKDSSDIVDGCINFALLIRKQRNPDRSVNMLIRSENQGIPDAEIVLIVEAWLEKVKQRTKDAYLGNFRFDSDKPKDDDK